MRLFSDRLDCYLAGHGSLELTLARGTRSPINGRGRVIDYRHFVEELKRKPQAFKGLVFRDALFPRDAYRRTWEQLELRLTQRQACRTIVALLGMAALDGVEAVLARRLEDLLETGERPDLAQLRAEFAPRKAEVPTVTVEMPAPGAYDALLPSQQEDELAEVAARQVLRVIALHVASHTKAHQGCDAGNLHVEALDPEQVDGLGELCGLGLTPPSRPPHLEQPCAALRPQQRRRDQACGASDPGRGHLRRIQVVLMRVFQHPGQRHRCVNDDCGHR